MGEIKMRNLFVIMGILVSGSWAQAQLTDEVAQRIGLRPVRHALVRETLECVGVERAIRGTDAVTSDGEVTGIGEADRARSTIDRQRRERRGPCVVDDSVVDDIAGHGVTEAHIFVSRKNRAAIVRTAQ